MALIFNEGFEATGYDETSAGIGSNWVEAGTATIDEDWAVSSVTGAPARWGDQCLKYVPSAGSGPTLTNTFDSAYTAAFYIRFDFILDSVVTDDFNNFFAIRDSSAQYCISIQHNNTGGNTYLKFSINNGAATQPPSGNGWGPISLDTCYRIDWYYNPTTDEYEIKVNGTSLYTGSATLADIKDIYLSGYAGATADITYVDLIQIATDGWVPADEEAGPTLEVSTIMNLYAKSPNFGG